MLLWSSILPGNPAQPVATALSVCRTCRQRFPRLPSALFPRRTPSCRSLRVLRSVAASCWACHPRAAWLADSGLMSTTAVVLPASGLSCESALELLSPYPQGPALVFTLRAAQFSPPCAAQFFTAGKARFSPGRRPLYNFISPASEASHTLKPALARVTYESMGRKPHVNR